MPGSFTTPTISATIAEGGSLTVTITPSSALGAATTDCDTLGRGWAAEFVNIVCTLALA